MNMDYEQFSQDVTATAAAKRVVDEFAKKQVDGVHICPRCGRMTVKERLTTNALSRHADVYICDACGNDEAVRELKEDPLLFKDWAIAKIPR